MKQITLVLAVVSLLLFSSFLSPSMAQTQPSPSPSWCDLKCAARCADAGIKKRCLKYCGVCCQKCSCVPSGTSGNKSECPCYRDMLSSKGTPKCP